MARRRYISTEISVDDRLTELAESNLLVPLLYTWMIPHAEDDATLRGTPRQIKLKVLPGVPVSSDQVEEALAAMAAVGLIEWDREFSVVGFPPASFYRYQTNVPTPKRRTASLADYLRLSAEPPTNSADQRETAPNAENGQRTAENSSSPSPSPSGTDDVDNTRARASSGDHEARSISESDVSRVATEYNRTFVRWPTPSIRDQLIDWLGRFSADIVVEAMRRAAAANTRTWAYAQTVLRNWDQANVQTMSDVAAADEAFRSSRRGAGARADPSTQPDKLPPRRIEIDPAELEAARARFEQAQQEAMKRAVAASAAAQDSASAATVDGA